MPVIGDKFGRASIPTDTAVATTVKTTRAAGVLVLEAFDLSKFATDTPVFFVTYKKTTDPVTGIVSITNLVSWKALVNSGANTLTNLTVQPGYVDSGNAIGDFIECIPTSAWENSLIDGIFVGHNPDGSFKTSAVKTALGGDAADPVIRTQDMMFDFVASGAVIIGLGYGVNLNGAMSAGIVYINGNRQTIAAVATRAYTINKDTYVDALYNASGTATIVYTEVANNAASPALAANSVRLGIVVTGATIVSVASINQGQEFKVLPIASSTPYTVTDSLGNLICPRDPNRKLLGYRQLVTSYATKPNTVVEYDLAGLSVPVIVPEGRKIVIKGNVQYQQTGGIGTICAALRIKEDATQIQSANIVPAAANLIHPGIVEAGSVTTTAGLHTYKLVLVNSASGPNHTVNASADAPIFIKVEIE